MTKKLLGDRYYWYWRRECHLVQKTCWECKDSFNGLKRESALDGDASVHWMDRTTSIRLKFMCPSDGHPRFNSIEIGVSMDRRKGRVVVIRNKQRHRLPDLRQEDHLTIAFSYSTTPHERWEDDP